MSVLASTLVKQQENMLYVMNKADTLETAHDFARAYGTLAWFVVGIGE